ncbi:hypothetical protein ROA7450_00312 [Roseovarius albus]|uniref:Phage-related minor tail protein n=1 Tax=Roseovarius albus TaxID=1247867 RepID=A0A1X6YA77_9RHOB|nr:hypothetical protein [Roseovarius albus]SLN14951.1 hypothetical protein ROA7450_00312 [Roseovarius albus]
MRHFLIGIMAWVLSCGLALAEDWPAGAKADMNAAGERLRTATTSTERAQALREIEAIAKAHPDAPEAQLLARTLGQKATMEAGPKAMLGALSDLATSGNIPDAQTYGDILAPLMDTIGKMADEGTLLPQAAIELDGAISALNDAAKKAGLPDVAAAISQATGIEGIGEKTTGLIGDIAKAAELARDAPDLAQMNEAETKKFLENMVALLPKGGGPAISGPAFGVFTEQVGWANEMFGESTKALDLVGDAIETGQFDHAAYAKIEERLNDLSKGPWGSDTAKNFFKSLCKHIPIAGAWCDDAFQAVEELVAGVDCDAITCDCGNVGGGLLSGPNTVTCKLQEESIIGECVSTKKITLTCDLDAKGPGASH